MKIYLAAPWAHRVEARKAGDYLIACGFTLTSRWLRGHEDTSNPKILQEEAIHDADDVEACETLVLLNLGKSDGKATEFGMAYAQGKRIIVVGTTDGNVFYHLPTISVVPTLEDAVTLLRDEIEEPVW